MQITEPDLTNPERWVIYDSEASVVSWRGEQALRLSGLGCFPEVSLSEGSIEVRIGAEDACYCGIAFRIRDVLNYELVYAQPHTSGRWDALQYDPVFHGVNTWQLYHGPGAQQSTEVPKGQWFRLKVDFKGRMAAVQLNDQPPLVIPRLAHDHAEGLVGIWSYKPAYFRQIRITHGPLAARDFAASENTEEVQRVAGIVRNWFLEGYGTVYCEPSGVLNLNRYLPKSVTSARLTRRFVLRRRSKVKMRLGFSDIISVSLDGKLWFEGKNEFHLSPDWNRQGYVHPDRELEAELDDGEHELHIEIQRTEYFGWGLILQCLNEHVEWSSFEW